MDEILKMLSELGLMPVDWVSASNFAELTGIAQNKLNHRRSHWPQDVVWTKQDGNIYYSLKGYNQWLSEQAQKRSQKACGLEVGLSKSTSTMPSEPTVSPCHTHRLRKISVQPLKLEVS